jgi:hypothetical protein
MVKDLAMALEFCGYFGSYHSGPECDMEMLLFSFRANVYKLWLKGKVQFST